MVEETGIKAQGSKAKEIPELVVQMGALVVPVESEAAIGRSERVVGATDVGVTESERPKEVM